MAEDSASQAPASQAPARGYARLSPSLRGRIADAVAALAVLAALFALFPAPALDGVWLRLPVLLALIGLIPAAWFMHRRRGDSASPILRGGLLVALAGLALIAMALHRAGGWISLAGLLSLASAVALRGSVPRALIRGRDLRVGERKPMAVLFENIESLASALVLVLLVWHFGLEAFRIPSGSMAPTLLGDPLWGDRVLVDKFAYVHSDPQRWEPVVFRYPLRRGEPYVKRCAGLPGEQILIAGGDIYARRNNDSEIELRAKAGDAREALWLPYVGRVSERTDWVRHFHRAGGADFDGGVIRLRDGGVATFPRGKDDKPGDAVDHDASFGATETPTVLFGHHVVGDLRLRAVAELGGGKTLRVTIIRDGDEYTLELRAGVGGCRVTWNEDVEARLESSADADLAGIDVPETAEFEFSLADGELRLVLDGVERTVLHVGTALLDALRKRDAEGRIALDSPQAMRIAAAQPAQGPRGRIELSAEGEGAVRVLGIDRDIYYIGRKLEPDRPAELPFAVTLGDDEYFVLGDNSPGSADARMWMRITLFMADGTQITGSLDDPTQPELAAFMSIPVPDQPYSLIRKLYRVAHFSPEERGDDRENADALEVQEAFDLFKETTTRHGRGAIDFWTEGGGYVRVSLSEVEHFNVQRHPYVQRRLFVGRPFAVFLSPRGMKLID